jgi:hypothetical protein
LSLASHFILHRVTFHPQFLRDEQRNSVLRPSVFGLLLQLTHPPTASAAAEVPLPLLFLRIFRADSVSKRPLSCCYLHLVAVHRSRGN